LTKIFRYETIRIMGGTITKKHFFKIWKTFGFKKAVRILFSKNKTALKILMED